MDASTEQDEASGRPTPLHRVEASAVAGLPPSIPLIVRLSSLDGLSLLTDVPQGRIAWLETNLSVALERLIDTAPLDVVLSDPANEFTQLYALARIYEGRLPRLSMHARAGVARAGAIAIALSLPVRLLLGQPTPADVDELELLLDRYLHDARAVSAIEPFHSALAALIHHEGSTLWMILERDPDFFPCEEDGPQTPDFVTLHLERLVASGAECAACPVQTWCAGYFKVPDPSYDCTNVRRLFDRLEKAAVQLQNDLKEAEAVTP